MPPTLPPFHNRSPADLASASPKASPKKTKPAAKKPAAKKPAAKKQTTKKKPSKAPADKSYKAPPPLSPAAAAHTMTLGDLTSSFDLLAGSGATGYNQGVKNSRRFAARAFEGSPGELSGEEVLASVWANREDEKGGFNKAVLFTHEAFRAAVDGELGSHRLGLPGAR
ncbi:hypothetical protein TeGR_g8395 [Tetraparma gracilis]|uniref:Uncharacterized protein n=1 Tax=Tetraparma gracilis TaxID=2962635 RepID=A0ABQ6MAT2_9STRA|nr:hypothetical protein TeGR_g8395 [Tetraparma gracilis]